MKEGFLEVWCFIMKKELLNLAKASIESFSVIPFNNNLVSSYRMQKREMK
jgi:hypothetical protein